MKTPSLSVILFCILSSSSVAQSALSLKPHPLPMCRSFFIAEFGYDYRVNSSAENTFNLRRRHYFTSDLGLMVNLNSHYALGVSHFIGMDNGGESRGGLKLTIRRWLNEKSSIDFSPGFLFWDTRAATKRYAFVSSLDLNIRDWFALTTHLEFVPTRFQGGTDKAYYFGLKTGSYPGFILNGVATTAAVIVGILFLSTGAD